MRRERGGGGGGSRRHRFTPLRHDERDVTEQILTDAVIAMSLREGHSTSTRNSSSIAAGIPQLPRGNSTMEEDLPPPVRYVVPERIEDASEAYARELQEKEEAYARELQEKELREPAQIKEDENLAKAIAMVQEDMVATVVPPIKQKKKRRRSSLFRSLFRRLRAPLSRRRREKFMKKIETSLSEGSRPPPPPVRIVSFIHSYTDSLNTHTGTSRPTTPTRHTHCNTRPTITTIYIITSTSGSRCTRITSHGRSTDRTRSC